MAKSKDTKDPIAWVNHKAEEALQRLDQKAAETPAHLWLPGFDIGAFPNHLNRSSLFAPIARGRRKFHRQTPMITRADCVLEYTGEQLDEADADLLMALISFAQPYPLGTAVPLNRAELLRKLHRSTGKQQYEWLHRRIKSLTEATIFIEVKKPDGSVKYRIGHTASFRIIVSFMYNADTETYHYILDPRWVKLFGNKEYSLIDWEKRMNIRRGQDMAKTLQRLVATSNESPQRYSLEWLKAKMEYSSPMRKFREALANACNELIRLQIISNWKIDENSRGKFQLLVWIPPSEYQ